MDNRYTIAVSLRNPSSSLAEVAQALVHALEERVANGEPPEQAHLDSAVRLMVGTLARKCRAVELEISPVSLYDDMLEQCRARPDAGRHYHAVLAHAGSVTLAQMAGHAAAAIEEVTAAGGTAATDPAVTLIANRLAQRCDVLMPGHFEPAALKSLCLAQSARDAMAHLLRPDPQASP